jgi:hypothetical protein
MGSRIGFGRTARKRRLRQSLVASVALARAGIAGALPVSAHAEVCPNASSRSGLSASLPDCRVYEMVTPPDNENANIYVAEQVSAGGAVPTERPFQASDDGNALAYVGDPTSGGNGSSGGGGGNEYLATRPPNAGLSDTLRAVFRRAARSAARSAIGRRPAVALAALLALAALNAAPASAATHHLYQTSFSVGALPVGVAVDNSTTATRGDVYVARPFEGGRVVEVFDSAGVKQGEITGCSIAAEPTFGFLGGFAVDPADGDLYVAETGRELVDKFAYKGTPGSYECVSQLSGSGTASGSFEPTGLAVDPANSDLYVLDGGEALEHQLVDVFSSAASGAAAPLSEFAVGAHDPAGLAVDSEGNAYVNAESESETEVFDSSGAHLRNLAAGGVGAVAVQPGTDEVYVSAGTHIVAFASAAEGNAKTEEFGSRHLGGGSYGVGVNAEGTVYASTTNAEVAVFAPAATVTLTVTKSGTGEGSVTSSPAGIDCGSECSAEFEEGKHVTLAASAARGSEFTGWSGDCESVSGPGGDECTLEMNAEKSVTAQYTAKHRLTVAELGSGSSTVTSSPSGIDCGTECAAEFAEGKKVTLTATAAEHSEFTGWSGCDSLSGPDDDECTLTIGASDRTVSAGAAKKLHPLNVSMSGSGFGEVTSDPGGISCGATCSHVYDEPKRVTLTAVTFEHSEFTGWSGDCESVSGPGGDECTLEMNAEESVTAQYAEEPTVTVDSAGSGSGSITCDAGPCVYGYAYGFPHGSVVTFTATANPGSTFAGWSGGGCSGTASCTVTIEADTTVTATFTAANTVFTAVNPLEACPIDPALCPPAAGRLKVTNSALVSATGAALKLTCSGGACSGHLKLTAKLKQGHEIKQVVIGTATFNLAAGTSKSIEVRLSGAAKRRLDQGKTLKAEVSGTGLAGSTVELKRANSHRRRARRRRS